MKKLNIVGAALAGVISVVLLTLWFVLGYVWVDAPLDLVISIIWWLIIAGCIYLVCRVEKRRRERIRTIYAAPGALFNPESGMRELQGADAVEAACAMLQELEYGFKAQEMSGHLKPQVTAIIRTVEFKRQGEAWEGEVAFASAPDDPIPFKDVDQLRSALAGFRAAPAAPAVPVPMAPLSAPVFV